MLRMLSRLVLLAPRGALGDLHAAVQIVEMTVDRYAPALYNTLGVFLPLIAVNCVILGGSLFMQEREYSLGESVVLGLGSGIGFAVAIIALAAIRERMTIPTCRPGCAASASPSSRRG
jgi:Na+-transporting NADH:ubiquinone oxidoreductase subunit NqrE